MLPRNVYIFVSVSASLRRVIPLLFVWCTVKYDKDLPVPLCPETRHQSELRDVV